jgi:D-amino-acid dehydrogenase
MPAQGGDHTTDVLIIGGGVAGVCAAYYLLKQGREVTLIDKGGICAGASYGNAGLIATSHVVPLAEPGVFAQGLRWLTRPDSPFYIRPRMDRDLGRWLWLFRKAATHRRVQAAMPVLRDLQFASLALYPDIVAETHADCHFEQRGLMMAFTQPRKLAEAVEEAKLTGDLGIEYEELDGDASREREPGLSENIIGSVFHPQDAHIEPASFVRAVGEHIQEQGARVLEGVEALTLERSGRGVGVVTTTHGGFRAREVVLAGGAWSPQMAQTLGLRLPIQPAKGYSVTVRRPDDAPSIPLLLTETRVAVTPMGDTLRFAGTLELAGMDPTVNMRRVQGIVDGVPPYLATDAAALELIEIWRGMRPCSPDGLPYIGRPAGYDNLTIAAGHSTIGLALGPITGKLVSQVLAYETPEIDLTLCDVGRYA